MKKWIYTVLVIASVPLWASENKKNGIKTDDINKSSNAINAIQSKKSSIAASSPASEPKKKKVSYPRGTIATH